ncbi:DgyrCDS3941 [Dimorphilus gyrociliatus]|nr:DgyrCDS3941 [Dimorphilus gyrociliatus]
MDYQQFGQMPEKVYSTETQPCKENATFDPGHENNPEQFDDFFDTFPVDKVNAALIGHNDENLNASAVQYQMYTED